MCLLVPLQEFCFVFFFSISQIFLCRPALDECMWTIYIITGMSQCWSKDSLEEGSRVWTVTLIYKSNTSALTHPSTHLLMISLNITNILVLQSWVFTCKATIIFALQCLMYQKWIVIMLYNKEPNIIVDFNVVDLKPRYTKQVFAQNMPPHLLSSEYVHWCHIVLLFCHVFK